MTKNELIRPAWTPVTITLMILGFMVSWPLGLCVIAYILWGDRFEGLTRDINRGVDRIFSGCRRAKYTSAARTGNSAFDDWRNAELQRLDEERRKLDEMREEFDNYVRELRRARDREEFDHFMAKRNKRKNKDGESDSASGLEMA